MGEGYTIWLYCQSTPLYQSSCGSFFMLLVVESPFWFKNFSTMSILQIGVLIRGGELSVLLLHHLGCSPFHLIWRRRPRPCETVLCFLILIILLTISYHSLCLKVDAVCPLLILLLNLFSSLLSILPRGRKATLSQLLYGRVIRPVFANPF